MSDDEKQVSVPTPDEFRMSRAEGEVYMLAQTLLVSAINDLGMEMGISAVMSGITRGLRRHTSIEDIQGMLRGLADTLPEVAKYDLPDAKSNGQKT